MSSFRKMKLVPIESGSKLTEMQQINNSEKLSKEDEVMNIAKSNLDEKIKKNIIKSLYADEITNEKLEKFNKKEPKIVSRKLLTPPSKKRKSTKMKALADPFESVKWNPY